MDKLREISLNRKKAHTKFKALKSKVYGNFLDMEQAAYSDGALSKKTKELIAVAIGVYSDCESCMQWHIEQAVSVGATQEEVLEAIEVAIEFGAGRRTVSARFALDVMNETFSN